MSIIDETLKYEGYLWMSNENAPRVYRNVKVDFSVFETQNPFVIEGNLYNKEYRISYSIKFASGRYFIQKHKVEVTDFSKPETIVKKEYLANRTEKPLIMKFLQYWKEENDSLCLDMPVLKFDKLVFVGFKDGEE